jgi:DNA-binding NtrC family response regulator
MEAYSWPGNVRELQNCLERAAILVDGDTIQPNHLNLTSENLSPAPGSLATLDLSGTLADVTARAIPTIEREAIRQSLRDADGDAARAADRLQIGYQALVAKMRQLGL